MGTKRKKQASAKSVKSVNAPEVLGGNVLQFRTREEREAERQLLARSAAESRASMLGEAKSATLIEFPYERVKSRGVVFNLPAREAYGQLSLDFDGLSCPRVVCDVVQLRPVNAVRRAYDLYVRASQLDEDPATYNEAQALYEEALRFDPLLAIAEVNLGNLFFRRGNERRAEELYRHAIEIQHRNPEGHYNLGYVMLERGDARAAADSFKTAIDQDPRFADAHFNLAMAHEQMGERSLARRHWKAYLDLEPQGTWADIARKHIS